MVDRAWSLVIICSLVEAFSSGQIVGACICKVLISVQLKISQGKSLRTADIAVLESSRYACHLLSWRSHYIGLAAYSCKEAYW